MDDKEHHFHKRFAGFKYAFRGVRLLFRYERNFLLHSLIAICVIAAGFIFDISVTEWMIVAIACGCVFAAEAMNTAIERLSDVVSPKYHSAIGNVKDISAGGVLLVAIMAVIVGMIIFLPKIIALF